MKGFGGGIIGPLRGPGSEGSEGKVLRMDRPRGRRVLKFDGAFGPRVVVAQWGHSVARVQKVQRVRPAFGRLVQRVAVVADAADYKKAGPRPPSFRPKPVSRQ